MSASFPVMHHRRVARVRISETARRALEKLVFQRHPLREWGTFFRFGFRRTSWGLSISYVDALPPRPDDLRRSSPIVSFSSDYISRMADALGDSPLSVGFVHSHPKGWGVSPSLSDDDMDTYFARLLGPYAAGRPYVSLIVNRDATGNFEFSGRAFDHGVWMPVTVLHVAGRALQRFNNKLLPPPRPIPRDGSEHPLSRWEALVGREVADQFAGAIIGVAGCSGTGSPVVEAFARPQVGEFVIVDGQRAAWSNLERMHGSKHSDFTTELPPFKVEIMSRLIKEVNPLAKVTAITGNILDDIVLDELLRCDLVLGATDTLHARAALGDYASFYFLPSIDVGVLPVGHDGRVTHQLVDIMRIGIDDPCPFCRGRIPAAALNLEMMTDAEKRERREAAEAARERGEDGTLYWNGDAPQLPTVGYLTTAAGSLAAGYGLNWLLGTAEMPHSRMQFDVGAPGWAFVSDEAERRQDCSCVRFQGYGDLGERSVTLPDHFARAERVKVAEVVG